MPAYLARTKTEIPDLAIRAKDESDARTLLGETQVVELAVLRADVAVAMGIPETRGVHRGVVWRWMKGPTNIFGELS
jgi:hypothetical protein